MSPLLAHQLQSLSDLFIAVANLLILHVCVTTSPQRGSLLLRWRASSFQDDVSVSAEEASASGERGNQFTGSDSHNPFNLAIASGNTGCFEMGLVAFWTFFLMLTLKGAIAFFLVARSSPGARSSSRGQIEAANSLRNTGESSLSFSGGLHAISSCVPICAGSSFSLSPASVAYLYILWLITFSCLFLLVGVPLGQYQACLFFSSYLATLGLLSPVAAGVIEELRSASVNKDMLSAGQRRSLSPSCTGHTFIAGMPTVWSLEHPFFLRTVYRYLPTFLQACLPFTFCPDRLGHVFVICALLPFIGCCFCSLLCCFLLPLDWQTTYIHFPFPLVIGGTVGHCVGSLASLLVVGFVIPCCSCFHHSSGGLLASPVLQELVLQRGESQDRDWDDYEAISKCGGAPDTPFKETEGSPAMPRAWCADERCVRRRLRRIR